jgi:hypothetical protein
LLGYAHATDGDRGSHRSSSTPLRRGATALAVAGGTLSLVGAGVPIVAQSMHDANSTDDARYRATAAFGVTPAPAVVPDDPADTAAVASVAAPLVAAVGAPSVAGVAPQVSVVPDATAGGPLVASTVQPVAWTPEPVVADGASLVKAVQLVEQQVAAQAEADRVAAERVAAEQAAAAARAEEEARAAATGSPDCGLSTSGLGSVKSHVREAAKFLGCQYGEPDMHGVAGRAGTSDHPGGLAIDFMVDRSTGDRLAQCALENQDALGVKYVIWEQQINHGNGWKQMEDRGGVTANHFDHVHISFDAGAGSGDMSGC